MSSVQVIHEIEDIVDSLDSDLRFMNKSQRAELVCQIMGRYNVDMAEVLDCVLDNIVDEDVDSVFDLENKWHFETADTLVDYAAILDERLYGDMR